MTEFNPDSYCGIYCGACSIAMYGKTGRADAFAACLANVPREDLVCGGCKSENRRHKRGRVSTIDRLIFLEHSSLQIKR